ncbi:CBS domain-containing protein [Sinorhizobium sojae]|uniref:CBS domain-containing protein n=1 Tax=Sinorhizobium sojae TaxID=716925 RepID=UPI000682E5D0|nr:CBS domain-containing protein [Sinorhizobium sojae]
MAESEGQTTVASIMTPTVYTISPDDSAQSAARLMEETGVGFLPVEFPPVGAVLGVISDRDIVTSVLAQGLSTTAAVREFMVVSPETCSPGDSVLSAAEKMASSRSRRLVVVNDDRRAIGVLALADIARVYPDFGAFVLASVADQTRNAAGTQGWLG